MRILLYCFTLQQKPNRLCSERSLEPKYFQVTLVILRNSVYITFQKKQTLCVTSVCSTLELLQELPEE